jgi:hypothetical protein
VKCQLVEIAELRSRQPQRQGDGGEEDTDEKRSDLGCGEGQKSDGEEEKYKEHRIGEAMLVQGSSRRRRRSSKDNQLDLPRGFRPVGVAMMQNFATAKPLRKQTLLHAGRAKAESGGSDYRRKVPR